MRSSIVFAIRKLTVLLLILVIGVTSFATPASASEDSHEKESFGIELAKGVAIEVAAALVPPAVCLAADAMATTFFPPAAALAPSCAALGIPVGTRVAISGTSKSIEIAQKAIAH